VLRGFIATNQRANFMYALGNPGSDLLSLSDHQDLRKLHRVATEGLDSVRHLSGDTPVQAVRRITRVYIQV